MPTAKPRINVVMEQPTYDVIKEFCLLSNRSMSSFLAETVEEAVPVLSKLIPLLRVAKDISEHSSHVIGEALEKIEGDISVSLDQLLPNALTARAAVSLPAAASTAVKALTSTSVQETPFVLTRGSVNQSMHQNGEKPRLWLASSSESGE